MNVSEFRKKLMDKFNQRIEERRARDARLYDLEDARMEELSEMIDDEFMELVVKEGADKYALVDQGIHDQLYEEREEKEKESLVGPPPAEEPSQDQESNDQ